MRQGSRFSATIVLSAVITLCFHKVGPASEEGRGLNIEPENLRRLVQWLKKRGGLFIPAWKLAEAWPDNGVCLTFDDCYTSSLTYGTEVLKSEGVAGSFYAVSGLVGKASEWDGSLARPLADWDLLRKAEADGFEIGCHTANHARLGDLSASEQLKEISLCTDALRSAGLDPKSFCLPYGSYNLHTEAVIEECGYQIGLALGKRSARAGDCLRLLPRVVAAYSDSPSSLAYKLWVKPKLYRLIGKT